MRMNAQSPFVLHEEFKIAGACLRTRDAEINIRQPTATVSSSWGPSLTLLQTGGYFCDWGHITSLPARVAEALSAVCYSMRGIAVELDKRKVDTSRGGSWHPQLVKRIVQRLDSDQAG
jgi:hypothetical protein